MLMHRSNVLMTCNVMFGLENSEEMTIHQPSPFLHVNSISVVTVTSPVAMFICGQAKLQLMLMYKIVMLLY